MNYIADCNKAQYSVQYHEKVSCTTKSNHYTVYMEHKCTHVKLPWML